MIKEDLTGFLKAIAKLLEDLSTEEFNGLVAGRGRLEYKKQIKAPKKEENLAKFQELIQKLKQADSRTEAEEILDRETSLKSELVEVAKILPVFLAKGDNKGTIKQKIMDSLVGSKDMKV